MIDDLKLSEETRDNVLIILEKNKEKSVKLKSNISIGRLEKNEIQFDYDDVSSLHATLAMDENNEIVLKDEFSTNGTFLNGERINEPKKIIKGDIIQVGSEAAIVLIQRKPKRKSELKRNQMVLGDWVTIFFISCRYRVCAEIFFVFV